MKTNSRSRAVMGFLAATLGGAVITSGAAFGAPQSEEPNPTPHASGNTVGFYYSTGYSAQEMVDYALQLANPSDVASTLDQIAEDGRSLWPRDALSAVGEIRLTSDHYRAMARYARGASSKMDAPLLATQATNTNAELPGTMAQDPAIPVNPNLPIYGSPAHERHAWLATVNSTYTECTLGVFCTVVDHHRYRLTTNPGHAGYRVDINFVELVVGPHISYPTWHLQSWDWFGENGTFQSGTLRPGLVQLTVELFDDNVHKEFIQSSTVQEFVVGEEKSHSWQTGAGYCWDRESKIRPVACLYHRHDI